LGVAINPANQAAQAGVAAAQAALDRARGGAGRFGTDLNDSNASSVATELSETRKAILQLTEAMRGSIPGLMDANSSANLRMNTRTGVFQNDTQRQQIENAAQDIRESNTRTARSIAAIADAQRTLANQIEQSQRRSTNRPPQ